MTFRGAKTIISPMSERINKNRLENQLINDIEFQIAFFAIAVAEGEYDRNPWKKEKEIERIKLLVSDKLDNLRLMGIEDPKDVVTKKIAAVAEFNARQTGKYEEYEADVETYQIFLPDYKPNLTPKK